MISHPISPITFNRKYNSIRYGNKILNGITKVLKQVFYPKYEYKKAVIQHDRTPKYNSSSGTTYKHIRGSTRLGNGFDTAVGTVIRLLKKYSFLRLQTFLDPRLIAKVQNKMCVVDYRTLNRLHNRRNPYLKMLLKILILKDCIPIADQVTVGHLGMKVGTKVDLVLFELKKKLIHIVELKTGYENYRKKSTNTPMNAPFQKQPDYPLNQHYLQLAESTELYKHTYPQLKDKVGESWLFYACSDGIDEEILPEWLKNKETLKEMQRAIAYRQRD
jgi:hypothetical protein